jgi:hypothetical protein
VKRLLQAALGDGGFLRRDAEQLVDADAELARERGQNLAARRRAGLLPKRDVRGTRGDALGQIDLGKPRVLAERGDADAKGRTGGFGHGRIILDVFEIRPREKSLRLHNTQ